MRVILLAALAAVAACTSVDDGSPQYMAVCYYGTWAVYRPGLGKFDVEDVDPNLCTHLIYGFAGLDPSKYTIKSLDPWNDLYDNYGKGAFIRFTNLKLRNPALKTILAIGGWNEGSTKYSKMAGSPSLRQKFVQSCVEFLHKYNFDGLDMDWEYPAERGGNPIDKDDYIALIKELKAAFQPEGLILTAAVGAGKPTIDDAYHIKEMGMYLDIVNVMTYDYHGSWSPFTGHVAPLYLSPLDIEHGDGCQYFSVNYSVNYYLKGGIPKHKMAMGIPLYGHGFHLDHADQHGLYAPASQPQPACPYTRQAGVCGFNEICKLLEQGGWTNVRDPDQKAIYSYKGSIWVGYDDLESMKLKTDYIKSMGLGGSMVWSIETDDFHNLCGFGAPNPLMTAIWTNLNGDIPHPTGPTPTTGPTTRPTDPPPPTPSPSHVCKRNGLNPDPDKMCSPIFYECVSDGDHWDATQEECASGTVFDRLANTCVWISESNECDHTQPRLEA
ncbi:acidic mammalian chitinase-like [Pollicipes pollicipes]|uniref:acidic mammalian chitinase-like n=1 Tax=Pollicipes pollicipes TaxID=41117 RepID=UPI0018852B99|nr:acidic mammalian chitinase-like [Pollicipes pollicipes]